jgi:hypothetical protein
VSAGPDVLSLPTPLARLYGTAMAIGTRVTDLDGDLAGDVTAAVVAYGESIALSPRLADDGERADVLAMGMAVISSMTNVSPEDPGWQPGWIYAPGGLVVITRDRDPGPGRPGKIANRIARRCGRDTAAFVYYVAADETEVLEEDQ